jgi:hypothetical protein
MFKMSQHPNLNKRFPPILQVVASFNNSILRPLLNNNKQIEDLNMDRITTAIHPMVVQASNNSSTERNDKYF